MGDGRWLMLQTGQTDRQTNRSTKTDRLTNRQGKILVQKMTDVTDRMLQKEVLNHHRQFKILVQMFAFFWIFAFFWMTNVTDWLQTDYRRKDGMIQKEVLNQSDKKKERQTNRQGEILVQISHDHNSVVHHSTAPETPLLVIFCIRLT